MKKSFYLILTLLLCVVISCSKEENNEQSAQVDSDNTHNSQDVPSQSPTITLSNKKEMLSFSMFFSQYGEIAATISDTTVIMRLPKEYPNDFKRLKPMIEVSDKASVYPHSLVEQDFSNPPVTYTVTAEDGSTQAYQVTVKRQQSSDTTDFSFLLLPEDESTHYYPEKSKVGNVTTYTYFIEYYHNIKRLKSSVYFLDPDTTITPASGSVLDYSSPITYTITAEDGTQRQIVVVVKKKKANYIGILNVKATEGNENTPARITFNTYAIPDDDNTISASMVSVHNPQLSYPLNIINIDRENNKITAETPATYYCGVYALKVTFQEKTEIENRSLFLYNGIPYFACTEPYENRIPYTTLVMPRGTFYANVFGKNLQKFTFFLRKNGEDFRLKYDGTTFNYYEMPELPSHPVQSGKDFFFVMKSQGKEYVYPFVNNLLQPIEVLVANKPIIKSLSKKVFDKGDEITVYGENLNFDVIGYVGTSPNNLILKSSKGSYWLPKVRANADKSVTYKISDNIPAGTYKIHIRLSYVSTETEEFSESITIKMPPSTHPHLKVIDAFIFNERAPYFAGQVVINFNQDLGNAFVKEVVFPYNIHLKNFFRNTSTITSNKLSKEEYKKLYSDIDAYAVIEEEGKEYKVYFNVETR